MTPLELRQGQQPEGGGTNGGTEGYQLEVQHAFMRLICHCSIPAGAHRVRNELGGPIRSDPRGARRPPRPAGRSQESDRRQVHAAALQHRRQRRPGNDLLATQLQLEDSPRFVRPCTVRCLRLPCTQPWRRCCLERGRSRPVGGLLHASEPGAGPSQPFVTKPHPLPRRIWLDFGFASDRNPRPGAA